jgi:hypothetical protein
MSTYEHIYFIIKLYENKPEHYKHIYFNIKRCENKSGHNCNLGTTLIKQFNKQLFHEWLTRDLQVKMNSNEE